VGGVAFGFVRSVTDSAGTRGTADSYVGALYASWTPGQAVVDVRGAIGPSTLKTTRTIILSSTPIEGSANAFGGGVSVEAGYIVPFAFADVKPYAGLAYQALRRDGFTETQPFGLTYPSQNFEKLTTTVGVAFSKTYKTEKVTLVPELKLGWGHDLRDTTLVSQAALLDNPFTINGSDPGRDALLLGVKLAGWTYENFRAFGAYNGEFRTRAVSHQVTGGVRYIW
jgi:outer membrane autotransporter protein